MLKKLALIALLLIALVGCTKKPETTTSDDPSYPYVDEEGRLNVDVSDYEFDQKNIIDLMACHLFMVAGQQVSY